MSSEEYKKGLLEKNSSLKIDDEKFRQRIRDERDSLHLSLKELAQRASTETIKITAPQIKEIETSGMLRTRSNKINELQTEEYCICLSEVFHCSPEYLAGMTNARKVGYTSMEDPREASEQQWKQELRVAKPIEFYNQDISFEDSKKAETIEKFVKEKKLNGESVYPTLFYGLAYAETKYRATFKKLWKIRKAHGKLPSECYTLSENAVPENEWHPSCFGDLIKFDYELFEILYMIAANFGKHLNDLAEILTNNYGYHSDQFL